jgi:hypothetical protein
VSPAEPAPCQSFGLALPCPADAEPPRRRSGNVRLRRLSAPPGALRKGVAYAVALLEVAEATRACRDSTLLGAGRPGTKPRRSPPGAGAASCACGASAQHLWLGAKVLLCYAVALLVVAVATCACSDSKAPRGRAAGH